MEHILERKLLSLIIRAFNDRNGTSYEIYEDTLLFDRCPALSLNGLLGVKVQGNRIRLEYDDGAYFLTEGGIRIEESVKLGGA